MNSIKQIGSEGNQIPTCLVLAYNPTSIQALQRLRSLLAGSGGLLGDSLFDPTNRRHLLPCRLRA